MRIKTAAGRLFGSVKPVITVRMMMPRISSMTAAPRMAVPTLPAQTSHFAQGLNRNGNRGRGQDNADKQCLEHVERIARIVVEEVVAQISAPQRNQDTDDRNYKRCQTGFFQFFKVSVQSSEEHQKNNTNFRCLEQKIGFFDQTKTRRTEQDAGNERTDHGGHVNALRKQPEQLGGEQNHCNHQQE